MSKIQREPPEAKAPGVFCCPNPVNTRENRNTRTHTTMAAGMGAFGSIISSPTSPTPQQNPTQLFNTPNPMAGAGQAQTFFNPQRPQFPHFAPAQAPKPDSGKGGGGGGGQQSGGGGDGGIGQIGKAAKSLMGGGQQQPQNGKPQAPGQTFMNKLQNVFNPQSSTGGAQPSYNSAQASQNGDYVKPTLGQPGASATPQQPAQATPDTSSTPATTPDPTTTGSIPAQQADSGMGAFAQMAPPQMPDMGGIGDMGGLGAFGGFFG